MRLTQHRNLHAILLNRIAHHADAFIHAHRNIMPFGPLQLAELAHQYLGPTHLQAVHHVNNLHQTLIGNTTRDPTTHSTQTRSGDLSSQGVDAILEARR